MFAERSRLRSFLNRRIKFISDSVEIQLDRIQIRNFKLDAVEGKRGCFKITPDVRIKTDQPLSLQPSLQMESLGEVSGPRVLGKKTDVTPTYFLRPSKSTTYADLENALISGGPILDIFVHDQVNTPDDNAIQVG